MRKNGFTAVELVLVIIVLAIIVGATLVQVDKQRQARMMEESRNTLLAFHEVFSVQGGENYPPLSSEPGQLAPTVQHLQEMFNDPRSDWREHVTWYAEPVEPSGLWYALTRDSYWYLGYRLHNEDAGLAFVKAYEESVGETGQPPSGDISLESPIEFSMQVAWIIETGEAITEKAGTFSILSPIAGPPIFLPAYDSTYFVSLRFPVFIERPGLHQGGSNVLWSDGKVEFIPYPGPWPMTEKFIKALESLDELKVEQSKVAEK